MVIIIFALKYCTWKTSNFSFIIWYLLKWCKVGIPNLMSRGQKKYEPAHCRRDTTFAGQTETFVHFRNIVTLLSSYSFRLKAAAAVARRKNPGYLRKLQVYLKLSRSYSWNYEPGLVVFYFITNQLLSH